MTDTPDPWGPYRATMEDHLGTCADYLGRLRRSLAGEIAPDRHYFADKAHQLHTAARRMVRIVQDIDRWLGECAATIEHADADGTRFTAECTLPAGHQGDHDGDVPLAARHFTGELPAGGHRVVGQRDGGPAPAVVACPFGGIGAGGPAGTGASEARARTPAGEPCFRARAGSAGGHDSSTPAS